MARGEWYLDEPALATARRACARLLDRFNAAGADDANADDDAAITVGADVRIGPRVQLLTALLPVEDHERRRAGWERPSPITIGAHSYARIGADCVVGAGSVGLRDVEDRTLVAGNPARMTRHL